MPPRPREKVRWDTVKTWQLLIAAGTVWALQALYFAHALAWVGFPDGFLTELARARKKIYPVLIALCAAASVASLVLGFLTRRAARVESSRAERALLWSLPIASALMWTLHRYLAASLDDGHGG